MSTNMSLDIILIARPSKSLIVNMSVNISLNGNLSICEYQLRKNFKVDPSESERINMNIIVMNIGMSLSTSANECVRISMILSFSAESK